MIAAEMGGVVVRVPYPSEMDAIFELRTSYERESIGRAMDVPLPPAWLVGDVGGTMRACLGFAMSDEHTMIATDLYDDGTRVGKRALSALLDDAFAARAHGVRIFVWVPLDRPRLAGHLQRRGMRVTGYSME